MLDLLRGSGAGLRSVLLIDPRPNTGAAEFLWPGARVETADPDESGLALASWLAQSERSS